MNNGKNGLVIDKDGNKKWYKNDKFHKEDGPAIEYLDGTNAWMINGELHRENGPAIEHSNGNKTWYINGVVHRLDGPAFIIYKNGNKIVEEWFMNGVHHREDGPAIEFFGHKYHHWYYKGKQINCSSQEEFERIIKLKAFW